MSNAKRFLSVVLAIIMVCSTLVIGANAAYVAYKDAAIRDQYNALDQAVLTTDQYAAAAMDEVDRMLNEEQIHLTRDDIFVGELDVTSIDATMDSVYALVGSTLFNSLKGMLGDLGNLNVDCFKPESAGGVRRTTPGKTDTDVIYAVLQLLWDNKQIFVDFVAGDIDLGSILPSLVDISEYTNVNRLLKSLLYEAIYEDENGDSLDAPDNVGDLSFDTMVQDLIDKFVIDEFEIDDRMIGEYFRGDTNISTGTMYKFLDTAVKDVYNAIAVDALNNALPEVIKEFCGVEIVDGVEDRSNLNGREAIFNLDYQVSEYTFTSATAFSQLNALAKNILDQMLNPELYVWVGGDNTHIKENIVGLAKAILTETGDDFFANYIEVADAAELDAMSAEELTAYALRAIINGSVDEMYIPEEATTIHEFGWYALTQLLATSAPELNFASLDKNSTDSLIIMGIDYAIYSVSSTLDMGLEYTYTMAGVDNELKKAAQYGIDNYGGLFSGIDFSGVTGGWDLIDTILFTIIDNSWLPTAANGTFKGLLVDCLIEDILNLDFDALLDLFTFRADSELQQTPKKVVINRVADILNMIFPGAINKNATTIDAIGSNAALAGTVNALFSTLWLERADLVASILPTVCQILDLTNAQEFEFPELTYDKMVVSTGGAFNPVIKIRNGSTGINTAYTLPNGVDKQQDQLYTYDIQSITSNISTISVLSAPDTIAAGVTEEIKLQGGLGTAGDGTLRLSIAYDVLTEDGSALTDEPIVEDVYMFLTKTADESEDTFTVAANNVSIVNANKNVFPTSIGDITDITISVTNANATPASVTPSSNLLTKATTMKAAAPAIVDETTGETITEASAVIVPIAVNTEATNILQAIEGNVGTGRVTVFEQSEAYKALPSAQKNLYWPELVEAMKVYTRGQLTSYPKVNNYTIGLSTGASYASCNLFPYNDYGLDSLVNSELTKHRQASGYSDAAAWATYQTALSNAVKAVYSPFVTGTFASKTGKASQYETASTALKAAIEALEASAKAAGVQPLQDIIDQYNPSNGDLEYDDPNYNYFGISDYVQYTYLNYRDEYDDARDMIEDATIPDENGEVKAISELDMAYMMHRISIYGERLLPVTPTKIHLAAELNTLSRTAITDPENNADGWSEESWAEFARAYAFATDVNNTAVSALKQSKINKALDMLLETEKKLVKGEGGDEPTEEAFEIAEAFELEAEDGSFILTGVAPDFDPEALFDLTNCTVEVIENDSGIYSTGAIIEIYGDVSGDLLATYEVAVFSDVNGDGGTDSMDVTALLNFIGGSVVASNSASIAGDITLDETIDSMDVSGILSVIGGSVVVDYENNEII